MKQPAAVIVEPEKPENTGMIARLTANFDYRLRLVNPGFNLSEARKTARKAQEKLRNARIYDTTKNAVEDLEYVVGTKPGRGKQFSTFEPRKNTSVMIGRESSGLTNEELELCDQTVHIATGDYSSINQANATAIMLQNFHQAEKPGISGKQKRKIQEALENYPALRKAVIGSNPEKRVAGNIIKELKDLKNGIT